MADLNMVTNLCESGDLEPLRDLLEGCPAGCCDGADDRGYIPLHTAVFNHRNRVAKFLLENRYSSPWFSLPRNRTTALHVAAYRSNVPAMQRLIERSDRKNKKKSIDACDRWGKTGLHHASFHANLEGLKLLLESGARADIRDRYGQTAAATSHLPQIHSVFEDFGITCEERTPAPRSPRERGEP